MYHCDDCGKEGTPRMLGRVLVCTCGSVELRWLPRVHPIVATLVQVGSEAGQDARRRVKVAELRPHEAGEAGRFDAVLGTLVAARLLVQCGAYPLNTARRRRR